LRCASAGSGAWADAREPAAAALMSTPIRRRIAAGGSRGAVPGPPGQQRRRSPGGGPSSSSDTSRSIEQSAAVARAPVLIAVVVPPWVPRRCPLAAAPRPASRRCARPCSARRRRSLGSPPLFLVWSPSSVSAVRTEPRAAACRRCALGCMRGISGNCRSGCLCRRWWWRWAAIGGDALAPHYPAAASVCLSALPLELPNGCPAASWSSARRWCGRRKILTTAVRRLVSAAPRQASGARRLLIGVFAVARACSRCRLFVVASGAARCLCGAAR